LGKKLGKKNKAIITLVDSSPTHLWKPLLHEIAAGTLNSYEDELNYLAYASDHYFHFCQGTLQGLDRAKKEIILESILNVTKASLDSDSSPGNEFIPQRKLNYDILIISIGSVANDFNIPGVKEHCLFLDTRYQADYLHTHLINRLMHL